MQITKDVICSLLADVETHTTTALRDGGYEPLEFISIKDKGFKGGRRTWSVTARVMKVTHDG